MFLQWRKIHTVWAPVTPVWGNFTQFHRCDTVWTFHTLPTVKMICQLFADHDPSVMKRSFFWGGVQIFFRSKFLNRCPSNVTLCKIPHSPSVITVWYHEPHCWKFHYSNTATGIEAGEFSHCCVSWFTAVVVTTFGTYRKFFPARRNASREKHLSLLLLRLSANERKHRCRVNGLSRTPSIY